MTPSSSSRNDATTFPALLGFAALFTSLEVALIWFCSERFLLERIFADDYFYYLQLAKNGAKGLGATFDGESQTNGFHPLYFALLVLFQKSTGMLEWNFTKSAMMIPLFAHNMCGVLAGVLFCRFGHSVWSGVVAWSWWLSPLALQIAGLGLESPLASVFFLLLILVQTSHRWRSMSSMVLSGICLGGAILARTDSLLALPLFLAWRTFAPWNEAVSSRVSKSCGVLLVVSAITSPWWMWNFAEFGTVQQSSGIATRLHSWSSEESFVSQVSRSLVGYFVLFAAPSIAFAAGILIGVKRFGVARASKATRLPVGAWACAAYLVVLCVYYCVYARHVQGWYVHSTVTGVFCLLFWWAAERWTPEHRIPFVFSIAVASFVALAGIQSQRSPSLQWGGYCLAKWVNANTARDAKIGSWNSGILGFFADRPVVNLDGVVNNAVVEIMREPGYRGLLSLAPYLKVHRVSVLTDYEPILPVDLSGLGFSRKTVMESPHLVVFRRIE